MLKNLWFGQIQSHVNQEGAVRGGQPVGFPFLSRRVMLNVKRQPPVGIALERGEHWRIDKIAVKRVGNK